MQSTKYTSGTDVCMRNAISYCAIRVRISGSPNDLALMRLSWAKPSSIALRLETLRGQSADDVQRTLVQHGNRQVEIGEFFDVTGSAGEDNELVWEGDCSRVKLIGSGLTDGRIRIDGNAGMHLGAEMTGGEIVVNGNTADWVGAEMHGGRIHVHGNAGHLVGAAYRGGRRGMTGGEILIDGNAGNEIGLTLRRGLIAVAGNVGDAVGFNMIAGSIFIGGEPGIRPGAGMRRGTIVFFDTEHAPQMLPTFKSAGDVSPLFLTLYHRHLRSRGFTLPENADTARYRRFCGDFLEDGLGEILILAV